MSLTAETLAAEIKRLAHSDPLSSELIACDLLPFIERHIAAGQTTTPAELAAEYFRGRDDGWEAAEQKYRQPPKPAGAVPATDEELHTSVCLLREWLARLAQGKELRPDAGMHSFASEEETFRKAGIANARVNASAYLPTVEKVLAVLAAREAAGRADAVLTFGERDVIETLLVLAYKAWCLADNTEDAGGEALNVERSDFTALSESLDKLNELPDDCPGYTMGESAKARWALRRILEALPQQTAAEGVSVVPAGCVADMPNFQRWTMARGSDGAGWSVYMDHADKGEWVKWEHVQQWFFGANLARLTGSQP